MWNECKGFIAVMAILLFAVCLIIIGMLVQREASNDELPRLKPQEVSMNVGFAPHAQRAQPVNYGYAQKAKQRQANIYAIANLQQRTYSYSTAPHAKNMKPTNVGTPQNAKNIKYPNGTLILIKAPEKKK